MRSSPTPSQHFSHRTGASRPDRRIRFVFNMLQSRGILTAPHGRRPRRLQREPYRFQLCRPIATVAALCAWGVAFVRLSPYCYDDLPTRSERIFTCSTRISC